MPFGKLDDGYYENHKVVERLSWASRGVLPAMISYAARHLTDGIIPQRFVDQHLRDRVARRALAELIDGGFVHRAGELCARCIAALRDAGTDVPGDGYYLHDYLEVNESLSDVERRRARQRGNKAASRKGSLSNVTGDPPPGDSPSGESRSGGSTSNETQEDSSDAPARPPAPGIPPLTDAQTPADEALQILRTCRRLCVDDLNARFALENAVQAKGGWGQNDVKAAAHYAVSIATDPTWRMTNIGALMRHALEKTQTDAAKSQRDAGSSAVDRGDQLIAEMLESRRA